MVSIMLIQGPYIGYTAVSSTISCFFFLYEWESVIQTWEFNARDTVSLVMAFIVKRNEYTFLDLYFPLFRFIYLADSI